MQISLITINHKRESFLQHQFDSFIREQKKFVKHVHNIDFEYIIINYNSEGLEEEGIKKHRNIFQYHIKNSNDLMNISEARNYGYEKSTFPYLIFIDVDCILGENFLLEYVSCFEEHNSKAVYQGHAWYLEKSADISKIKVNNVHHHSQFHKPGHDIRSLSNCMKINVHSSFTSIHFAMKAEDFEELGGFDEYYLGYGCEDTDFAMQLESLDYKLYLSKAEAYHQYHKPAGPPYDHISEFVRNANYFYSRWGFFPAPKWIEAFEKDGYIEVQEDSLILKKDS